MSTFQDPEPLTSSDRTWGMLPHLGACIGLFVGAGYLGFIAPLVIWIMKKDESEFAADQAKEALNFQIFIFAVNVMLGLFVFLTLGLGGCIVAPLMVVIWGIELVLTLVAAFKANEGTRYRYPNPMRLL